MQNLKVLLIEDEEDIARIISIQLGRQGHEVVIASSGEKAVDLLAGNQFDLFIIDRMLPGISGLEVCKRLRKSEDTLDRPILFVTALSSPEQVVEGLEAGADDYIGKPFDINILIARINSLIRRYRLVEKKESESILGFGPVKVDFDQRKAWCDNSEIKLTTSEFKILGLLIKNARKVLSRKQLVEFVLGEKVHVTERTIDTHVAALRKKLGVHSKMIETIRGVGYRVDTDE